MCVTVFMKMIHKDDVTRDKINNEGNVERRFCSAGNSTVTMNIKLPALISYHCNNTS